MSSNNAALSGAARRTVYRFADWPNPAVPNGRIGVYTVWREQRRNGNHDVLENHWQCTQRWAAVSLQPRVRCRVQRRAGESSSMA